MGLELGLAKTAQRVAVESLGGTAGGASGAGTVRLEAPSRGLRSVSARVGL